jgi:UDP:flavonoid glycosyltransferase YjiC (YdhE family)
MKISIVAVGSRGDVLSYVALALGLKRTGHSVQLIAAPEFQDYVHGKGLEFASISTSPNTIFEEDIAWPGRNVIHSARFFKHHIVSYVRRNFYELFESIGSVDAIIYSPLAHAAIHLAEFKQVPAIGAFLQPLTPTHGFGPTHLPPLSDRTPFKGRLNWLRHWWNSKAHFYLLQEILNECRQEVLSLPPLPWHKYANADSERNRILYGFSNHVVPRPPDWHKDIRVTGYWFMDSDNRQPPEDLVSFINAGPPPVYVGFGSMIDRKPHLLTRIVAGALSEAGQRGILATGLSESLLADLPENVFPARGVPHDWLFPLMSAVVHHGDAGMTATGLRAGVPGLAVPFASDQAFWGSRLEQLGVGPGPIPRKQLTVDNLAEALRSMTNSQACRDNAHKMALKISVEDGVGTAVKVIKNWLLN